jgi:L,D-transpeptidase ErfK/SrfK
MLLAMQAATARNVYALAETGTDVVGALSHTQSRYEDTLIDLGRLHNLGFEELRRANPQIDPWLPGEGSKILLPNAFVLPQSERRGIVINIAEYRIYYFYRVEGRAFVATAPASVGRMDWATPLGRTAITAKVRRPSWYPPASVRKEYAEDGWKLARIVPPGPDNPLGEYALRLGLPGYLIHGTNRPDGVGMRVTHGCIRLFPEDIEWLFPRVDVNTPVQIVNQPVKFGWQGDDLYLEVHPALEVVEDPDAGSEGENADTMTLVTQAYVRATAEREGQVDWQRVAQTFEAKLGIPVKVGTRPASVAVTQ